MQDSLLWTFKKLHYLLEQYGKTAMKNLELTPTQSVILLCLLQNENRQCYAVNLHDELGLSKAAVSDNLKELKKKGYLRMEGEPSDDRRKRLVLTEQAYDTQRKILAILQKQKQTLCGGLSEERVRQLEEDLRVMTVNVSKKLERSEAHDQSIIGAGQAI